MNSVKTAVVVVVLLGVLYGVYKVLNVPEQPLTPEEQEAIKMAENLEIQPGTEVDPNSMTFGPPTTTDSAVAGQPYEPAPISPAEMQHDSSASPPNFAVPPLTPQAKTGEIDTRGDFAVAQPPVGQADGQTDPSGTDSSPDFAAGLPPLDGSPERNTPADAGGSFYERNAKQARTGIANVEPDLGASNRDSTDIAARGFDRAMYKAEDLIAQGEYRDALAELTRFYDAPSLSAEDQQKLVNLLDPLAGKVIYSSEHLLEHPRVVRTGEELGTIAYEYGVPEKLLHNVNRNQVNNPRVLRPGTELKVIRGPFEAHISLGKGKLTLFVGELYAGHFPITVGRDPAPQPGTYYVKQIMQGRDYVTNDGRSIPADSPDNPYGRWWIDLGSEMSIHGAAGNGNSDGKGCVSLSAVDISDLAEILSRDSKVRIEE